MKCIIIALIVCGVFSVLAEDNLGTSISLFLQKFKEGLYCGFGEGISMAPLILANSSNTIEFNIDTPDLL